MRADTINNQRAIARGGAVNLAGTIADQVLGFVGIVLAARLFSVDSFGLYALAVSALTFVHVVGLFGMENGVMKFVAQYRAAERTDLTYEVVGASFRTALVINLVVLFALSWLAPLAGKYIFDKPDLTVMLRVLGMSLPFLGARMVLLFSLRALRIMSAHYYSQVLRHVVFLGVVMGCWRAGLGGIALGYAYVVSAAVSTVGAFFLFARHFRVSQFLYCAMRSRFPRELLHFSVPQTLSQTLNHLLANLDVLLIGFFLSSEMVGIYRIASRIADLTLVFFRSIRGIFAPIISSLHGRGDLGGLAHLYECTTRWVATVNLPILAIVLLYSEEILGVFGPAYRDGSAALMVLGTGQFISAAAGAVGFMLIMSGFPGVHLTTDVAAIVLNLTLNLLLIPRWGIEGAAVATALSIGLVNLARLVALYGKLAMHPYTTKYLKPLAATGVAFATMSIAEHWFPGFADTKVGLIVSVTCMLALNATMLVLLRIESEDRRLLLSILRRRMPQVAG